MKKYRLYKRCGKEAIHALLFACYYYLVSTLCWLILAPNQLIAIRAYEHNTPMFLILLFGFLCALLLTVYGSAIASINSEKFSKKGDVRSAIKSYVDFIFCFSLILVPIYVLKNNVAIRALCPPPLLIAITGLFFVMITANYYRARRDHSLLKGMTDV